MVKFLKPGKVVILLNGKYAGKKAVIVESHDQGDEERKYGYAVVAGIHTAPKPIAAFMDKAKIARRSRVGSFIKVVNYVHVMPTRYALDLDLQSAVTPEVVKDIALKKESNKKVRSLFEERYNTGKNRWFFEKLRF